MNNTVNYSSKQCVCRSELCFFPDLMTLGLTLSRDTAIVIRVSRRRRVVFLDNSDPARPPDVTAFNANAISGLISPVTPQYTISEKVALSRVLNKN